MKKINKKGFTLIELLAIIVILAIIAVITVPIILNIIDEAKKGAEKNSVIGYGKAVELAYTQYQYENSLGTTPNSHVATTATQDGKTVTINIESAENDTILKVDFDGDKVVCTPTGTDKNTISSGKIILKHCQVNAGGTFYDYEGGKATPAS